jgi:hypothetical protein
MFCKPKTLGGRSEKSRKTLHPAFAYKFSELAVRQSGESGIHCRIDPYQMD